MGYVDDQGHVIGGTGSGTGGGTSDQGYQPGDTVVVGGVTYVLGSDNQWHATTGGGGTPPGGGGGSTFSSGGGASGGGISALSKAYTHLASAYGFKLTSGQISALTKGNVSVSEFQQRLEAVKRIDEYKPALDAFEFVIKKKLSVKDRLSFVLGQAPHDFYQAWEKASIGTALETSGFNLSETPTGRATGGESDLAIGHKELAKLANELPGLQTEASVQRLASQAAQVSQQVLPVARQFGMKLSRNDILLLEAGMGSVQHSAKITKILNEIKASQAPVRSEFQQTSVGPSNVALAGMGGGEQTR